MKREVFFLCFTSLFCAIQSQNYYVNETFLNTHAHVVNFRKKEASQLIEREKQKTANQNVLMYLLESQLYFIEAFLYETPASKKQWTDKFPFWEKALSSGNKNSPYYNYCIAHLYFQRGLLGLKHLDYFQAGFDIRKASRLLENNYKKFPDFYIQYKEMGLLNCFIGNIPEQYEWLTGIAGMKGDLKGGEQKLKRILELSFTHKEFHFLQIESLLYYSTVATILSNDRRKAEEIVKYLPSVQKEFLKSPVYLFLSSNLYAHLGRNEKALQVISANNSSEYEIRFDYLDYFTGLLLLQKGSSDAKKYFLKFIRNFNGLHYIKSAYHKLAWCWLLEENYEQYEMYISLAKNSGIAINDADKQAYGESKRNVAPHPGLLRARLLSDGGYYAEALVEILSLDSSEICNEHRLCVEYNYRKARIHHYQNELQLAVNLYKTVIEIGSVDKEYFAANSALMLGNIFEEKKDFHNARHYYKMCLTLPFEDYRNSIQQKAKAGLQRIN